MKLTRNWKLTTGVAAGIAVLAAGGAVAATKLISPTDRSEAIVSDAAKQLGVEPDKLSAALKKALENQVDADVAAARITKAEGEALKKRIESNDYPLFGVGGPGFGPRGFGFDHHLFFADLDTAADYLGLTEAQLRTELENGKTLADVAKDQGKSVDGLVDALVADAKAKLADAVKAGHLTQADADRIVADLRQRIADRVNGIGPRPGFFGFGHRPHLFGGLAPAARYLGLTEAQLRTELESGKTLAEVAKDKGKSVDGLVDALLADAKAKIDAAVAAGRLSRADADRALADLKQRVTDRVNGVRGPDGLRGFHREAPDFSGPPAFGPPA